MFTGIIEELGKIQFAKRSSNFCKLTISGQKVLEDLNVGDSIAVNGVCLTVTELNGNCFQVDVTSETLKRTNLRDISTNKTVNLERSLKVTDRFGGHFVSGHIDGLGVISKKIRRNEAINLTIDTDPGILKHVIPKGSIAIDGVSLTVVDLSHRGFTTSIIPHTAEATTLGQKGPGLKVNLEVDMIGKYVEKYIMAKRQA